MSYNNGMGFTTKDRDGGITVQLVILRVAGGTRRVLTAT